MLAPVNWDPHNGQASMPPWHPPLALIAPFTRLMVMALLIPSARGPGSGPYASSQVHQAVI